MLLDIITNSRKIDVYLNTHSAKNTRIAYTGKLQDLANVVTKYDDWMKQCTHLGVANCSGGMFSDSLSTEDRTRDELTQTTAQPLY